MATALTVYPRYRWTILAVAVGSQVVASVFYAGWAALTPFLRADFGLTREQVGLIVAATATGSAFGSIPLGRIGDRVGARRMLTAGLSCMAVLALLTTVAPSFPLLFASIFVAGLAYAGVNPTGVKVLVPWFPRHELGTAVGIKQMGYPLGGALAAVSLPGLALWLGSWRPPIAAAAVLIGLGAFVSLALLRDRPAGRPAPASIGGRWWTPILHRNILLIALVTICYAVLQASWLGHLVLYLQEGVGLPVTVAAGMLALTQVGSMAGRVGLGVLSDRLFGGRRRELLIACGLVAGAVCAIMALLAAPPLWLLVPVVVVFGLSGGAWPPLQLAMLADEGGERSSGILAGLGTAFGSLGVTIGPPLFGRTVDLLGTYTPAWAGLAVVGLLGALLTTAIRERPAASRQ